MAGLQDYLQGSLNPQQVADIVAAGVRAGPATVQTGTPTWIGGGLSAGLRELRGSGGAAVQALGKLTGLEGLEQWGAAAAANNFAKAQEVGRPDLEHAPWSAEGGGFSGAVPWAVYQTAKALPLMAGMVGAGIGATAAAPAWVPGAVAGGIGATAAGYAPSVGNIYRDITESAKATGQPVTAGDAGAAFLAGVPHAALGAALPQVLHGVAAGALPAFASSLAGKVATAGAIGAATQVPAAGLQASIDMAFRPDLSLHDKMAHVVDAALTGGALGGVMGAGAGALRSLRGRSPTEITNEDLTQRTAEAMEPPQAQLEGPPNRLQLEAPAEQLRLEGPNKFDMQAPEPQRLLTDAAVPQDTPSGRQAPEVVTPEAPAPPGVEAAPVEIPAAAAISVREQLLALNGGNDSQAIRKAQAVDLPDALNELLARFNDPSAKSHPAAVETILRNAGVLDEAGQPRNLAPEIEAAQVAGDTAKIADLQAKQGVVEEAARRRTAAEAPAEPVAGVSLVEPPAAQAVASEAAAALTTEVPTPPAPTTQFRTAEKTTGSVAPLSSPAVDAAYAAALKKTGIDGSKTHLVEAPADLPPEVAQAAVDQGLNLADVRGVLHKGEAYIVKSNIRSVADVQETLMHEVFGHKGAQNLFGADAPDRMVSMFDAAGGVAGIKRIAQRFGATEDLSGRLPDGPLSNADKARVFDEMLAQAAESTGKVQTVLLTWAGQIKQHLVRTLNSLGLTSLAERFKTFTSLDTAVLLRDMRKAANLGYDTEGTSFATNPTVPEANEAAVSTVGAVIGAADRFLKQAPELAAIPGKVSATAHNVARSLNLNLGGLWHIVDTYGKLFGTRADGLSVAHGAGEAMNQRTALLHKVVNDASTTMMEYAKLPAKAATAVKNSLVEMSLHGIAPAETREQNIARGVDPTVYDTVMRRHQSMRQQGGGTAFDLIRAQHAASRYQEMLVNLDAAVKTHPEINLPIFQTDPIAIWQAENTTHSPLDTAPKMKAALEARVAALSGVMKPLQDALDVRKAAVEKLPPAEQVEERKRIKVATTKLDSEIGTIQELTKYTQQSIARVDAVPYAHLGRSGNYFVAGKITGVPDAEGKVSAAAPKSLEVLKAAVEKGGFDGIEFVYGNDNPSFYAKVETAAQADNLRGIMDTLAKQGHIEKDSVTHGSADLPAYGKHLGQMAPEWMNKLIERFKNDPAYQIPEGATDAQAADLTAARDRAIRTLTNQTYEMMPDGALNKMLIHRVGVQGHSTDFVRSQMDRFKTSASNVAGRYASPKVYDTLTEMNRAIQDKQKLGDTPSSELADMRGVWNEIYRRQADTGAHTSGAWDTARAITHGSLIAGSPANAALQLTQMLQLGLPELGSRYGYMKAGKAMAQATPEAFRILKVAMSEGWAGQGTHGLADMRISRETLEKAGLSKSQQDFLIDQTNAGAMASGSQTQNLGLLSEASVPQRTIRIAQYANALNYSAEMLSRLVVGLATHKLDGANPNLKTIAADVQRQASFDFSSATGSKLLSSGPEGLFGRATGLASVFLRFQSELVAKLYREAGDVFSKGPHGDEARKFMAGHLAAMTVLGGTMALPMVSVFARAADKLVDVFSEDGSAPFDVKAGWRNFLFDTFGKEMGDVMARGVPRAFGADLSARVGEQDIVPFSRFLTDRRKLEDNLKDTALGLEGAGVSNGMNVLGGLNDIFNHGDVLQGMIKMLPTVLRNPAKAYQLATMGYVDSKNAPLPLTATARSIAAQALGFNPSEKADYQEARLSHLTRKTDLEATAGNIRKHIATAIEQGDGEGVQAAMQQMQVFDIHNPAYAVGPSLSASLAQRQRAPAMARAYGAPLGFNPKDVGAMGLTRYLQGP